MPDVFCLHRLKNFSPISEDDLEDVRNSLHSLRLDHSNGELTFVWSHPWPGTMRLYVVCVNTYEDFYVMDVVCPVSLAEIVARDIVAYAVRAIRKTTLRSGGGLPRRVNVRKGQDLHNWADTVAQQARHFSGVIAERNLKYTIWEN